MNSKLLSLKDRVVPTKPIYAVYMTLGYPDFERSVDLMVKLGKEGADIIEIGIPFSDPIADGPIIQYSSNVALKNRITLDDLWKAVQTIKENCESKVVVMTYGNLIFKYGIEKFVNLGLEYKLDGIILPDVPPELYPEKLKQLRPIHIISPNSDPNRIEAICKQTGLFLYVTSHLSTTGGKKEMDMRVDSAINIAKNQIKDLKILVGFGISQREDVSKVMGVGADGIVVGSALIETYKQTGNISEVIEKFKRLKF